MIVITAPTSMIGRQVLDSVLRGAEPVRVIARDPSRLSPQVREQVQVVEGSHGDPVVLNQAFSGAASVFWLLPPNLKALSVEAAYVDFTRPACAAFRSHGVKRVVGISALGRGTAMAAKAGFVTASLAMDDLIASSGVSYRALTMPSFMDNLLRQLEPIKSKGMFFSPIDGDRKAPACATRDIAAAATKWLLDTSWRGIEEAAVLGPQDVSFNEMAQIMTQVLGKPVRFQQIPFEAYKARFVELGMSPAMAQGMTDMADAKNRGLDNAEPRTSANTTPTSFRQWCELVLKPAVLA